MRSRAEDAGADWELRALVAVAQAMAGRRPEAEQFRATAAERAADARESVLVVAARAAVAAEYSFAAEATDHARAANRAALDGAHRASLLVMDAGAKARQDRAAMRLPPGSSRSTRRYRCGCG